MIEVLLLGVGILLGISLRVLVINIKRLLIKRNEKLENAQRLSELYLHFLKMNMRKNEIIFDHFDKIKKVDKYYREFSVVYSITLGDIIDIEGLEGIGEYNEKKREYVLDVYVEYSEYIVNKGYEERTEFEKEVIEKYK